MTEEVAAEKAEGTAALEEIKEQPEQDSVKPEVKPEGEPKPEDPEKPKGPRGVAKRLQELARQRDEWKALALQKQEPDKSKPLEPLKTLKDFEYDEAKYAEHVFSRSAEIARREAEQVSATKLNEASAIRSEERTEQSFRRRESEFSKTVKDYAQVAYHSPITPEVVKIVKTMEEGPELAYYLGKNPDIAESLNELNPLVAAIELGRIAAELSSEKSKSRASASKAPPPVAKIEASEPGKKLKSTDPEAEKLSGDEWMKLREKELAALRRK